MSLQAGDTVRVFPHGKPECSALATVAICSENERAIAVGFDSRPPFALGDPLCAIAIHPEYGIMLFASREAIDGKPWGPWIEMIGGGHYEMEKI